MRARMRDGVLIEFHCVQKPRHRLLCEPGKRNYPTLDLTNIDKSLNDM
jgi:hypothetical protein